MHLVLFCLQDCKLRFLGLIIILLERFMNDSDNHGKLEFTLRFTNEVTGAQQCD